MNIKHCLVICCVLCAIFFQSCKKGCTNPTAFNYVKSAKVDDGSCMYCDSTVTAGGSSSTNVDDLNSSSPFYNFEVINITVLSNFIQYNGNGCQLLGHTNNSSTGTVSTYYTAIIQNVTSSTVTFSGSIQIEAFINGTETILTYYVSNIVIQPSGTTNINLGSGGQQQQFSGFSVFVSSPTFSYH